MHMATNPALIAGIVEPLKAEHAKLAERRDELQTQLDEVRAGMNQLEKILRAADPDSYIREPGKNGSSGPSEEAITRLLRAMWAEPARTFTMSILVEKTQMAQSSVSAILQILRQRGDVRSIGRVQKAPGQLGQPPLGFKIAEGAQVPEPAPTKTSSPKRDFRKHVTQKKIDEVYSILMTEPGRTWTRSDINDRVPWHRTQVDFAFRALEEDGKITVENDGAGNSQRLYTVVSDGS
jgi:hypothetical protein